MRPDDLHDDDALADALAAVTSSIPVISQTTGSRYSAEDIFAALMDDERSTAADAEPGAVDGDPGPTAAEGDTPADEDLDGEPESAPHPAAAQLPSEPPQYEPGEEQWRDLALHSAFGSALQDAPPPRPESLAVPPPGSPLPPPPRVRSLDDDALAMVLNRATATAGVAGALAELEVQMELRDEDAREFDSWERSLRAMGTTEALNAIDAVRSSMRSRLTVPFVDEGSTPQAPVPEPVQPMTPAAAPLPDHSPQPVQAVQPAEPAEPAEPAGLPASRQPVFSIEANSGQPTPLHYRAGRATRMFWQWFALNSSVVTISVGAVLFGLGMSVRQALVAVLAGVALSLLPLGAATLAGKVSGQPTMIVSRAAFGVVGNTVPAGLAVLSRVFWGAFLLWLIGVGTTASVSILWGAPAPVWTALVAVGVALALASVVAVFGYALLIRCALALGILSAVLVAGVIALTAPRLDLTAALLVGDGPWALVVSGAVLVFSLVGLAWANAGAEVARYQRPGGSGAAAISWTIAGAALPALLLLGYGVLLASSDSSLGAQLRSDPVAAIASLLPSWYSVPLVGALVLSLICGVVLTLYSGGFSLRSVGVAAPRIATSLIVALAVGGAAVALTLSSLDLTDLVTDVVPTLAVPVAAWAGIFASDLMIRNKGVNGAALLRRRDTYGDVNWANLGTLIIATVVGLGFTSATLLGLSWQGYLWPLTGLASTDPIVESDAGVIIALALGLLAPLLFGVPRIRRQEAATP